MGVVAEVWLGETGIARTVGLEIVREVGLGRMAELGCETTGAGAG